VERRGGGYTHAVVGKGRLEAFTDGVVAILITILVLELRLPEDAGGDLAALRPALPVFLTYVLSFVFLGIYWTNHHHMLHAAETINGAVLWANLHLLFWLSLVPFMTGWMGRYPRAALPVALYGAVLLASALAYTLLQICLIRASGRESPLAAATGSDVKGKVSMALYVAAIWLAFERPWIAQAIYVIVALIWIVPDRRIESRYVTRTAAR
jgi:TMEM175 potassium channel family protein